MPSDRAKTSPQLTISHPGGGDQIIGGSPKTFEPYRLIQEPNEGAREGLRRIVEESRRRKKPAFLFVNNRLEGNAPGTIEAVVDRLA